MPRTFQFFGARPGRCSFIHTSLFVLSCYRYSRRTHPMATDSKSEKKKKRSSTSTSEGRDVSKRRRTSDDEEKSGRGSSRRDEREHDKSHKRSKHHSDKEKKSKEKRKSKDSKHGRHSRVVKPCELSSDDYFSKNNEFSTWLKEDKNIFFSDLSSERARELFSNFVKKWNADKLEPKYYEGIATAPRTAHSWKIRN